MKKITLLLIFGFGLFSKIYCQDEIAISDKVTYKGKSILDIDYIKNLDSLNINFQLRGNCYAFSSKKYAKKSNGEAHSENIAKVNNGRFEPNLIGLFLSKNEFRKISKNNIGHTLYLINTTKNKLDFFAQDSRLKIVTEVKNKNGQWTNITYLPSSGCGNSYHKITLGSNEYWEFAQPIYKGNFTTKLRYKLTAKEKIYVSNEIETSINLEQLNKNNKQGHKPKNIMDPYNN